MELRFAQSTRLAACCVGAATIVLAVGNASHASMSSLGGLRVSDLLALRQVPVANVYSLSDDFTGAGTTNLAGRALATGQSWTVNAGTWSVTSGTARTSNTNTSHAATVPWVNRASRLSISLVTSNVGSIGLLMHAAGGNTATVLRVNSNGVTELGRLTSGVFTQWATTDVGATGDGAWTLAYSAGTYTVTYQSGAVAALSYTVPTADRAALEANTLIGLYGSRGGNNFRFDNFAAVTL